MAPTLTAWENVRLQRHVTAPMLLGGVAAPNRRFAARLARSRTAERTIHFLRGIRRKHGPRAWCLFPFAWTLLVLDGDGIEEVLASDSSAADPVIKRAVLSRFTPRGVIISRGDAWVARRAFNEDALAFGRQAHPGSDEFVEIVKSEVRQLLDRRLRVLAWRDFSELGDRISQQVIFGRGRFEPRLARHLTRLVAGSNWAIRRPRDFSAVFRHIEDHLNRQAPQQRAPICLVQRSAEYLTGHAGTRSITDAPSQVAFWLFVIKDMIELHVPRTLALIATAPDRVRGRLRQELPPVPALTASGIGALRFLDACIKEQLRLWTPVPSLLRVATRDVTLHDGTAVRAGQQMFVHAGAYHRDAGVFGAAADSFDPESRFARDVSDARSVTQSVPPLYIFSRHRQSCAGQFLAMLLLKATLATLLAEVDVVLLEQAIATESVPAAVDHVHLRFQTAPVQ